MITKQGYKGLGLGVNEHGIKYHIHIPSKPDLHGVGCSKSQVKEGEVNHHHLLHKLLPTPTLNNSNICQEVAKHVYIELMSSKKEIFKHISKDALSKYKCPFDYHNSHLLIVEISNCMFMNEFL